MYSKDESACAAGCVDVFNAFLVRNAEYDKGGTEEIPCVKTSSYLPEKVIPFSKALSSKDYDCWVVFYEHDVKFVRVWNQPRKYLDILKRFRGVISPDSRSYEFCFDGVEKNSTVAIGTHGCIKKSVDREEFIRGLAEMVERLTPRVIVVYGAAPDSIFKKYRDMGIEILQFDSVYSITHTVQKAGE